ncbi:MAG: glycoside hydrolase family 2 [Candidatus Azobacteroides sp.]|nr:glycoside hydrolase family 2 [Candidatus Azobacteroides sp.]
MSENWQIQSSAQVNQTGEEISLVSFSPSDDWYSATVPSTVMGVLCKDGLYPNIMFGTYMKSVDKTLFNSSWWFWKEFSLPELTSGQQVRLDLEGISYRANIWLNGTKIAGADTLAGPFRRFSLDISPYVKKENVLAIEVFKAKDGEPNIGFADWNPRPADESMGIFREVFIRITEEVSLKNTVVRSDLNTETLQEAWLTIETELVNHSNKIIHGHLIGTIENNRSFTYPVTLQPNETKQIRLDSTNSPALHLSNPRIWWCNNLGKPEMYELELSFQMKDKVSDEEKIKFGIRKIKDYFTEKGERGFMLNGKKILIKGGGWTDDLFLRDTDKSNEIQVRYAKDMNLNTIRLENMWGKSQKLYDLCDENGIMLLAGWSCQWEWSEYLKGETDEYGGIITDEQMNLIAQSFEDQVLWLRNHPSVIAWFLGSDKIPRPALEKKYCEILGRIDDRPYMASAARVTSEISGPTGMKMNGPYEYVGPNYWYEDRRWGGAYGFNTETGIGAQLPILESIKKFIPESALWPVTNENWNYHCTSSQDAMNNLSVLTEAMNRKYGKARSLEEYITKAQVMDYEGTRAMFEAFRVKIPQTTGIIQWMMNSAWPSLYWQLYDYYLVPTAGYYAAKKANQPQQAIYNYEDNCIYVVNERMDKRFSGMMHYEIYSLYSELMESSESMIELEPNRSRQLIKCSPLEEGVFISLRLIDSMGEIVTDNFYWVPENKDVFNWDKTNWMHTPTTRYADLTDLNEMLPAQISAYIDYILYEGKKEIKVTVRNLSTEIAFFTQLLVQDEEKNVVVPIEWSDNYISLLPGEEKVLKCRFAKEKNKKYTLSISGWNVEKKVIEI